jgi:hypothetical protein
MARFLLVPHRTGFAQRNTVICWNRYSFSERRVGTLIAVAVYNTCPLIMNRLIRWTVLMTPRARNNEIPRKSACNKSTLPKLFSFLELSISYVTYEGKIFVFEKLHLVDKYKQNV